MRKHSRQGVTLLELLIAVMLVSLLTVAILFAMRTGFTTMERTNDRLQQNRRVLGAQRALEGQIGGFLPVKVACGGAQATMLFDGTASSMRLVSRYSLEEAHRGYPRLLEYLVIPGAENRGVRLIVNETIYAGPSSIASLCVGVQPDGLAGFLRPRLRPIEPGPRSFVLADQLAFCRLSYLLVDQGGRKAWSTVVQGMLPPEAVRVEMAPIEPDPSRLQMGSLSLPVHVNRFPGEIYVDLEQ